MCRVSEACYDDLSLLDPLLPLTTDGSTTTDIDIHPCGRTLTTLHNQYALQDNLLRSKTPAITGQIADRFKLQHPLAKHSDKNLFVAEQVAQMLFSSSLPASGLSPGMTVSRRMPPCQQLANLEAATAVTNSSHLNGQAAIAGPLGIVQNMLVAFWAIQQPQRQTKFRNGAVA